MMHKLIRIERDDPEDLETLIRTLYCLCLLIFLVGMSAIVLYEIFKNGIPPEPTWWLDFEATIGITW